MRSPIPMLLALCLPLAWSSVAAQTDAESPPPAQTDPQFRFGVQAGLNFATWGGDDADGIDTRTGFLVGGFAEYRLSQYFSLRPELAYSQQGFEAQALGFDLTLKQDFIQIPLLFKAGASLEGQPKLRPVAYAGPTVSFEVSCEAKVSGAGVPTQEDDCPDDFVKGTDFGLMFGAGLEYGRVSLTGRYLLGLTSVDDTGSDADVKNRVLAVLAGVRF
jgi:hypothetical protein